MKFLPASPLKCALIIPTALLFLSLAYTLAPSPPPPLYLYPPLRRPLGDGRALSVEKNLLRRRDDPFPLPSLPPRSRQHTQPPYAGATRLATPRLSISSTPHPTPSSPSFMPLVGSFSPAPSLPRLSLSLSALSLSLPSMPPDGTNARPARRRWPASPLIILPLSARLLPARVEARDWRGARAARSPALLGVMRRPTPLRLVPRKKHPFFSHFP